MANTSKSAAKGSTKSTAKAAPKTTKPREKRTLDERIAAKEKEIEAMKERALNRTNRAANILRTRRAVLVSQIEQRQQKVDEIDEQLLAHTEASAV